MKYLLLVVYLFSTASFAGHCSGASHDRDHDDAKHSEMKEESSNTDSDTIQLLVCCRVSGWGCRRAAAPLSKTRCSQTRSTAPRCEARRRRNEARCSRGTRRRSRGRRGGA